MDYRYLGKSALKISPLCLGTMMFGGETDEKAAQKIIESAYDQGINFLDTADVYQGGNSEIAVGKAVSAHRDDWVIASKFGYGGSKSGPNQQGQSRKWIIQTVEASLKRLQTDYIDILYFHRVITDAPLEEGLRTISDLIRQGKVRYYGVSNFRGWRIAEIVRLADKLGMERPVVSQPLYNIVDRNCEVEQLPAAGAYGLGVVPYSPLARGILTGKYRFDAPPGLDTRAGRGDMRIMQTEWRPESLKIAQEIVDYCKKRGVTPVAFALAWILKNQLVSSVIAGPRTQSQWESYRPALNMTITAEDEAFIDGLVRPGHSSTYGYTDPGYPVEGRKII